MQRGRPVLAEVGACIWRMDRPLWALSHREREVWVAQVPGATCRVRRRVPNTRRSARRASGWVGRDGAGPSVAVCLSAGAWSGAMGRIPVFRCQQACWLPDPPPGIGQRALLSARARPAQQSLGPAVAPKKRAPALRPGPATKLGQGVQAYSRGPVGRSIERCPRAPLPVGHEAGRGSNEGGVGAGVEIGGEAGGEQE